MKKISIIVLVVAVVVLAGIVVWQNWIKPAPAVNNQPEVNQPEANESVVNQPATNQPSANCAKEGENIFINNPEEPSVCCSGLSQIQLYEACNAPRVPAAAGIATCSYCGNGVCGLGENKCNCPADCK